MRKIIALAAAVEILAVAALAVNAARSYAGTQETVTRAQVSQANEIPRHPSRTDTAWRRG